MFLEINDRYYHISSQDEAVVTEKIIPKAQELGYRFKVIHNFDNIDGKNIMIIKVSLDDLCLTLYNSVKYAKETPSNGTCLVVAKHKVKDEVYGFYILPGKVNNIHVTYMDHINLVRLYYPINQIKTNLENILGHSEWRNQYVPILRRMFGITPPVNSVLLNQILKGNQNDHLIDNLNEMIKHLLVQDTSFVDQETLEKYGFIKDGKFNKKMFSLLKNYFKINCIDLKMKKIIHMEGDQVTYSLKLEHQ